MKQASCAVWPLAALTLLLGACSLAPTLNTPVIPAAEAYKEIGPWTQAQPADRLPRDSWWTFYDSAELDGALGRSTNELPDGMQRPVVHADDLVAV